MNEREPSKANELAPLTSDKAQILKDILQHLSSKLRKTATPLIERLQSIYETTAKPLYKRQIKVKLKSGKENTSGTDHYRCTQLPISKPSRSRDRLEGRL